MQAKNPAELYSTRSAPSVVTTSIMTFPNACLPFHVAWQLSIIHLTKSFDPGMHFVIFENRVQQRLLEKTVDFVERSQSNIPQKKQGSDDLLYKKRP